MNTPANEPGPGQDDQDEMGQQTEASENEDEKQTAFLPMDIFSDTPKIGDVCKFRVVDVSKDGEIEVEYVSSDTSGSRRGATGVKAPWEENDSGGSGGEGGGY